MGNSSQRVWWLRLRDLRKSDHEEEGGTAVTGTWAVIFTTLRHTHNFSFENCEDAIAVYNQILCEDSEILKTVLQKLKWITWWTAP